MCRFFKVELQLAHIYVCGCVYISVYIYQGHSSQKEQHIQRHKDENTASLEP